MSTAAARDAFDHPWKEMREHACPELMAFYFPDTHARTDWTCAHVVLNNELRRIVCDTASDKRVADALVRVTLLDGTEQWVYLHLVPPRSLRRHRRLTKRRASHAGTPVGMGCRPTLWFSGTSWMPLVQRPRRR